MGVKYTMIFTAGTNSVVHLVEQSHGAMVAPSLSNAARVPVEEGVFLLVFESNEQHH